MLKVSVYYPRSAHADFDFEYYCHKHVPMVLGWLGAACKSIQVEKGIGGGNPCSEAPNIAVTQMMFESMESFQAVFAVHSANIFADTPNYTNIAPQIQFGELLIA